MPITSGYSSFSKTLQAFVSEYAVTGKDAGTGSLLAALAEAGFLIGLEKNRFGLFSQKYPFYKLSYCVYFFKKNCYCVCICADPP